jgi:ATPase complex subunit ATP10
MWVGLLTLCDRIKEASQGYFHDYNLARKHNGGKLYLGPPVLIREDVSAGT